MKLDEKRAVLLKRREQLTARLAILETREKAASRRQDARRKIIAGALLIAAARSDIRARLLLVDLAQRATQRDRAALASVLSELEAAPE